MGTNMLAAKKIKLHGLMDKRWNAHDHLTQYRGLVKLFERDRKIIDYDTKLSIKKNKKEMKKLLRDIYVHRKDLENAITGDRQRIKNLLAQEKNLKMAYQELPVGKIIDHIFQDNFSKRKTLDLLNYRMKLKIDKLIKLRLEEGDLEDHLNYTNKEKSPLDIQIGIVTGKVQDMILKKEAAITVKNTYSTLIQLMTKDAIYYDAVLDSLKQDGLAQGHCLIQTIKLGQLATEYLDDRKVEYETLQAIVKTDMKLRTMNLEEVNNQIKVTIRNLRELVRRDSDITVTTLPPVTDSKSYIELNKSIQDLTSILKVLQDTTLVSNFDCIFPCMEKQGRQSVRLQELVDKLERDKANLLKQKEHAEMMSNKLMNSVVPTTDEYKVQKAELKKQIRLEKERWEKAMEKRKARGSILTEVRKVLQGMQAMTEKVQTGDQLTKSLVSASDTSIIIEPLETNGAKIIGILNNKVQILMKNATAEDLQCPVPDADYKFAKLISKCSKMQKTSRTVVAQGDFIEDITVEDGQIPTREHIRAESDEICRQAAAAELQ